MALGRADNLRFDVTADTSKLRSDLALAQVALKDFGKELRAAAAEARRTGETAHLDAVSQRYEAMAARVKSYSRTLREAGGEHTALGTVLDRVSSKYDSFSSSMRRAALGAGVAAAGIAAGFVKMAKSASDAADELEDSAGAIGVSVNKLLGIQLAAAKEGAAPEFTIKTWEKLARTAGDARTEYEKLHGKIQGTVPILRSYGKGAEAAADKTTDLERSVKELGSTSDSNVTTFRGNKKEVVATATAYERMKIKIEEFNTGTEAGVMKLGLAVQKWFAAQTDAGEKASVGAQLFGREWKRSLEVIGSAIDADKSEQWLKSIGLGADDVEKAQERQKKAFMGSLATLQTVSGRVKTITGLILSEAIVPFFDSITKYLADNSQRIFQWARDVVAAVKPVLGDLSKMLSEGFGAGVKFDTQIVTQIAGVLRTVETAAIAAGAALSVLVGILQGVAEGLNWLTGSDVSGWGILAVAAILQLTGAFRLLFTAIQLVVGLIALVGGPFTILILALGAALLAAIYFRKEIWEGLVVAFNYVWGLMKQFAAWVIESFVKDWNQAATDFTAIWTWAVGFVTGLWDGLISLLNKVIQVAKDAWNWVTKAKDAGAETVGSGVTMGMARGGPVRGAGTSRSDSILGWLSDGEFVMQTAAVRKWGLGFMHRLNQGFAAGGLVGHMPGPLRLADGGAVEAAAGGGGQAIANFSFESGRSFALSAPPEVVKAMVGEANRQQMRSAGAKPLWYAGRPSGR